MDEIRWLDWIDSSHWLSLYPKGHPKHEDGFGDCPHATGYLVTAMILNGEEIPWWFNVGTTIRHFHDRFERHPNIDTSMNRDQLTPLVFVFSENKRNDLNKWLIKKYAGPLFPHQYCHFRRSMNDIPNYFIRLICDSFECLDSISDWFSNSESSQIKNIYRLVIAENRHPTFMHFLAKYLFCLRVDPQAVMKEYFTRYYPLQPPIFEPWIPIIDRHFKK